MAVITEQGLRKAGIAAALAVFGYAGPAAALEFGSLAVHSRLDQPLDATLALKRLTPADRASLQVGIAPTAMFERFGIRRSSIVDRLQVDTRYDEQTRRAYVHLSTRRPVAEPFVDFLLQVQTGDGRALREYTAMLDPAGMAPSAASGAAAPSEPAASRAQPEARAATAEQAPATSTHRVRDGETLWSIAAANTPSQASVAQTMLAIYRANPEAFGDSMAQLRRGAVVELPSADRVRQVDASQARKRAGQLRSSSEQPSEQAVVRASGQAPPAHLEQSATSADSAPNTSSAANAPGPSEGSAEPADARQPDHFGRLSPPADTPWSPTKQSGGAIAVAAKTNAQPTDANIAADTDAGPDEDTADSAASTAVESETAAVDTGTAGLAGSGVSNADDMPPRDVAASQGSGWLSLRNLGLLALVLLLALLGIRRWQERRYRPIELGPADDDSPGDAPPEQSPEQDAASPTAESSPAATTSSEKEFVPEDNAAGHAPASTPATPEPRTRAFDSPAGAHAGRSGLESPIPAVGERTTAFGDKSALGSERTADPTSTSARPRVLGSTSADDAVTAGFRVAETEPRTTDDPGIDAERPKPAPGQADAAALGEKPAFMDYGASEADADPVAPDSSPDRPRRAATNEEIEALAFESQPLPAATEREHDLGDSDDNSLRFETESEDAQEPAAAQDEPVENSDVERYGLEMIDPGEFDLYDPPSETAGQSDDDPNDSIEIRLDLARMYIDMDDQSAARELLEDVRQRGDEQQQRSATELLQTL